MRINHILYRTSDLPAMVEFLVEIIGLEEGYRPPFRFPGAWIYSGETALFHLVETGDAGATGNLDHVALEGADYSKFVANLDTLRYPFQKVSVPETGQRQVFLSGPDGLKIEMLFEPA